MSTREAEELVVSEFLAQKAREANTTMRTYPCKDEEQTLPNVWRAAGKYTSDQLNRQVMEYQECQLFTGALVRITHNGVTPGGIRYSNGQLAYIHALPDDDLPFEQQRLSLRLVPVGVQQPSSVDENWPIIQLPRHITPPVYVGKHGKCARREQWGVRYYCASTVTSKFPCMSS